MEVTSDEARLVISNCDDDAYGLWEMDWAFNTYDPLRTRVDRIGLLKGLVERGLVEVYFGPRGAKLEPLSTDSASIAVSDWDNWTPPTNTQVEVYQVMATNAALDAAYRQMSK